jgi:hypothetical protein
MKKTFPKRAEQIARQPRLNCRKPYLKSRAAKMTKKKAEQQPAVPMVSQRYSQLLPERASAATRVARQQVSDRTRADMSFTMSMRILLNSCDLGVRKIQKGPSQPGRKCRVGY